MQSNTYSFVLKKKIIFLAFHLWFTQMKPHMLKWLLAAAMLCYCLCQKKKKKCMFTNHTQPTIHLQHDNHFATNPPSSLMLCRFVYIHTNLCFDCSLVLAPVLSKVFPHFWLHRLYSPVSVCEASSNFFCILKLFCFALLFQIDDVYLFFEPRRGPWLC